LEETKPVAVKNTFDRGVVIASFGWQRWQLLDRYYRRLSALIGRALCDVITPPTGIAQGLRSRIMSGLWQVLTKCNCSHSNDLQIIMAGRRVDFRPDLSMKRGGVGDATSRAIEVYVCKRAADRSREESVFDLP
jgi:hypothetical protein